MNGQNLAAVLFGCLLSVLLIGAIEVFFQFNEKFRWIVREYRHENPNSPLYDTSKIDFSYLKDLKPYEGVQDHDDRDDYPDASKNFACNQDKLEFGQWWLGKPNCSAPITLKKKNSRRVVYTATYSYDQYARRKIPAADMRAKYFLMFLGCSFTFGEGVEDHESFANLLTKKVGHTNAYNVAMVGWGIHQSLKMLQSADLRTQGINGRGTVAIFTVTMDHLSRALRLLSWVRGSPHSLHETYYYLEGDKLISRGTMAKTRPLRSWLLEVLSKSSMLSYFNVQYPPVGDQEIRTVATIYGEIAKILREKYHVENFVFSVFPEREYTSVELLRPYLEKYGFTILDFSRVPLWDMTQGRAMFFGNGHPSPLGHRIYADLLYSELSQRGILAKTKARSR